MSAEKFQKMRAVNKKFKTSQDTMTAKQSTALEDKKSDLRSRGRKVDEKPEEIALRETDTSDITVTLDEKSYRAKAGTAT
jgi:hypothetical protein